MNRSVLSEEFHSSGLRVAPGTLTVGTSWTHPSRGPVDCPAHLVLTAQARKAGLVARSRPLSKPLVHDCQTPASLVFTVSYEKPDGRHGGLAVAVDHTDATAVSFARRQVESWRAVLRTRRVLYVPTAERAGAEPRHSPPALVPAQEPGGARKPHNVCGCPETAVCPSAGHAQRALRRFLDRGDEVIVVGIPLSTAAVMRDDENTRGRVIRVGAPGPAATIEVADPERLSFVVAPGAVLAQVADILKVLRLRFPRLRGQHPGEWCYAMDNFNTAVASALNQSDSLLVTGPSSCPVARTGVAEAAKAGLPIRGIPSLGHLRPEDIDATTITVLETPGQTRVVRQLGQVLGGLGPISHIRRRVHSEDVSLSPAAPAVGGARPDDARQVRSGGWEPIEAAPD